MALIAFVVTAVLVVGVVLLSLAVFLAKRAARRSAAVSFLAALLLLALGGNYARCVPALDEALDWIAPPSGVRVSQVAECAAMARTAVVLVGRDGGEDRRGKAARFITCPVETVVAAPALDVGSTVPIERCWANGADRSADAPLCYQMAFVEVDRHGLPVSARQLRAIHDLLAGGGLGGARPTFAIAYVHGWRHGAGVGDDNVRRLRVQAAYAAAHLRERCRTAATWCGARVVAIYVGWPGATGWDVSNRTTAPHFPRRKRVSDEVGFGILRALEPVYADVHRVPGSVMMLEGHSLGGNAVLTAATPRIEAALPRAAAQAQAGVAGHAALIANRLGLPADLTVLLNPAAESGKLYDYRVVAARYFATNPEVLASAGRLLWPSDMPPRLVIIAGRCENPPIPSAGTATDAMVDCDSVVEEDFLLSQERAERRTGPLLTRGIGHLPYDEHSSPTERHAVEVSTSGYVEVNIQRVLGVDRDRQPRNPTEYGLVLSPRSRCMPEPAWLYCARTRGRNFARACGRAGGGGSPFNKWDLGKGSNTRDAEGRYLEKTLGRFSEVAAPGQANIQFGYPSFRGRRPAAAQRSDPVWSLDANRTAVSLHNTVASAPLLCAFSKLLLDNPSSPGNPDQYVKGWKAYYWRRYGGFSAPDARDDRPAGSSSTK